MISRHTDNAVKALQYFGYTDQEARFLTLAALNGGYFLRRQFSHFIGKALGGTTAALVEKTAANGHTAAAAFASNTIVYHLCSRSFYRRIGQPENRNRRERQPLTVKSKLMGLDFVLDYKESSFLATSKDRLDHFSSQVGSVMERLPSRRYASRARNGGSLSYFVEAYPIMVGVAEGEPFASFAFIDEGMKTTSRFETFLRNYSPLLASLPSYRVIYVAASARPFDRAEAVFRRHLQPVFQGLHHNSKDYLRGKLIRHFVERRDYEARLLDKFDTAKLVRFRSEREAFGGERFDKLFTTWLDGGGLPPADELTGVSFRLSASNASFSTYVLPYNYDFFGSLIDG